MYARVCVCVHVYKIMLIIDKSGRNCIKNGEMLFQGSFSRNLTIHFTYKRDLVSK